MDNTNKSGGFWFFLASIPISATIAIYGAAGCIGRMEEARHKARQEYYKSMSPVIQEWAKQGVKSIKID